MTTPTNPADLDDNDNDNADPELTAEQISTIRAAQIRVLHLRRKLQDSYLASCNPPVTREDLERLRRDAFVEYQGIAQGMADYVREEMARSGLGMREEAEEAPEKLVEKLGREIG